MLDWLTWRKRTKELPEYSALHSVPRRELPLEPISCPFSPVSIIENLMFSTCSIFLATRGQNTVGDRTHNAARSFCWYGDSMKRKYIIGMVVALLLLGALIYVYGGSQAPPGQPPLRSLTAQNVGEIKSEFNAAKNEVRVLVLLSPT